MINWLNSHPAGAGGEGGGGEALEISGSEAVTYEYFAVARPGTIPVAKRPAVPQTGREYLATNPLHRRIAPSNSRTITTTKMRPAICPSPVTTITWQ